MGLKVKPFTTVMNTMTQSDKPIFLFQIAQKHLDPLHSAIVVKPISHAHVCYHATKNMQDAHSNYKPNQIIECDTYEFVSEAWLFSMTFAGGMLPRQIASSFANSGMKVSAALQSLQWLGAHQLVLLWRGPSEDSLCVQAR